MSQIIEHASPHAFEATTALIVDAIESAGLTIFARIDHSGAAKAAGLQMPPTAVLIYGNPVAGTPLMLACPDVALDLPLRVLIREDTAGHVQVAFHAVGPAMLAAGIPQEMAIKLQPAQQLIVKAIEG